MLYRPFLLACLFLLGCGKRPAPREEVFVYPTYEQLSRRLAAAPDTTFILNFWATTCPPCRREMPFFEQLAREHADDPVQVITISMDKVEDAGGRVRSFILQAAPHTEALLMADPYRNRWTAEVDTSWYGALPATLLLRGADKRFHFGAFASYQELTQWLAPPDPDVSATRH
jgi:thiol-disulfide isomerase/thioredoxin